MIREVEEEEVVEGGAITNAVDGRITMLLPTMLVACMAMQGTRSAMMTPPMETMKATHPSRGQPT